MTLPLAELDAIPISEAAPLLASCCGAPAWIRGMLARRPYGSRDAMFAAAEATAATLSPDDWLAAFSHHPRIGEHRAAAAVGDTARKWSEGEQGAASSTVADLADALREGQRAYESRFGYIFIVCASGRSTAEILGALRTRLRNAPDAEMLVAAGEQRLITRLRLEQLVPLHTEHPA